LDKKIKPLLDTTPTHIPLPAGYGKFFGQFVVKKLFEHHFSPPFTARETLIFSWFQLPVDWVFPSVVVILPASIWML
jgi:hypothetical protein